MGLKKKMIRLFLSLFLIFAFQVKAKEQEKEKKTSSYRYIVDNYFSSRSPKSSYQNSRFFSISYGMSFYRTNAEKKLPPLSSTFLSFTQDIKHLNQLGNVQLRASVMISRLQKDIPVSIELTPLITFPELETAFPIYFGWGLGLGFYPYYVIEKKASFSLHSPFLVGFRLFELYSNLGLGLELDTRLFFPFNELQFYLENRFQIYLIFQF